VLQSWPTATIFTIGHSTRMIAEFVTLLQEVNVGLLVDVRSIPRSRTNPQFNSDVLPESLATVEIAYRHLSALGGLRHQHKDAVPTLTRPIHQDSAIWRGG
jgi:uncharacterized protein (DUF488 family)